MSTHGVAEFSFIFFPPQGMKTNMFWLLSFNHHYDKDKLPSAELTAESQMLYINKNKRRNFTKLSSPFKIQGRGLKEMKPGKTLDTNTSQTGKNNEVVRPKNWNGKNDRFTAAFDAHNHW